MISYYHMLTYRYANPDTNKLMIINRNHNRHSFPHPLSLRPAGCMLHSRCPDMLHCILLGMQLLRWCSSYNYSHLDHCRSPSILSLLLHWPSFEHEVGSAHIGMLHCILLDMLLPLHWPGVEREVGSAHIGMLHCILVDMLLPLHCPGFEREVGSAPIVILLCLHLHI